MGPPMTQRDTSDRTPSAARIGLVAAGCALLVAGLGAAASDSVGQVVSATWQASGVIGGR